jgi:hypothetical protein
MARRCRSALVLGLLISTFPFVYSATASETITYSYDTRGRLVKVVRSGAVNDGVNACYSYDGADNRTNVTVATISCTGVSAPPSFAISDATVTEGGTLIFTVAKAGAASGSFEVSYATADGSAASTADYASASGTLAFAAGELSKTVSIATADDASYEGTESFVVNLSGATGSATITDAQAIGTITDNDAAPLPPSFAINDVSTTESGNLVFTVTKTGATSTSFSVNFATANGTAASGDYAANSGTLTFAASDITKTITIVTTEDATAESNETVLVNLSDATGGAAITDAQGLGTIVDNEVALGINDAGATEGGPVTFTVTKIGSNGGTVSVHYATATGTAGSGDFTSTSGTLTFGPADTERTISVNTNSGDAKYEMDEYFYVNLSAPTGGATISDAQGEGLIFDYWGSLGMAPTAGSATMLALQQGPESSTSDPPTDSLAAAGSGRSFDLQSGQ